MGWCLFSSASLALLTIAIIHHGLSRVALQWYLPAPSALIGASHQNQEWIKFQVDFGFLTCVSVHSDSVSAPSMSPTPAPPSACSPLCLSFAMISLFIHACLLVCFFFFSFCNETSTEQNFVETSYKANTNPEADSCTTGHCPISCWFLVPGASHFNVRDVHVISIFLMLLLGCMNVLSPFYLHICWKVSSWSKIQPAFPQNHDSLALLPNTVAHMSGNSNTANQMLSKVRARLFSSPVSELVEQWMVSIFWFPASGI